MNASPRLAILMSTAITACMRHSYLPQNVMSVILRPLVKNKMKDITSSENYRPVAIASATSKLIECIMSNRMKDHLECTDYQFAIGKSIPQINAFTYLKIS